MNALTPTQARCLRIVENLIERKGYSPTTREIMDAGGWRSTASVSAILYQLRRLGVITYTSSPRTIRVVEVWDADDA